MEMKIGDLDRASEGLGRMGFVRGCAVQLGDGARFFGSGSMLLPCCILSCLWVFYYGIAGVYLVVYPISSVPSLSILFSERCH